MLNTFAVIFYDPLQVQSEIVVGVIENSQEFGWIKATLLYTFPQVGSFKKIGFCIDFFHFSL